MQGDLAQETLAVLIRNLYVSRKSGILHLRRGEIEKRIYFRKGSIIFANSDLDEDRLGEFLIRSGKIERPHFEIASRVMKDTRQRFGRTIVELGHMSEDEMQVMVMKQIEAIIYSLFLWDAGNYRFEPHENPVDEDIILNLSTADIILEGTRRMSSVEPILRALGDPGRVLRHSENPLLLYQKISLTPAEGFVLSRVDGTTTLADLAAISPLGEDETYRCVYGLVAAGVLELEGAARRPDPQRDVAEPIELPRPEAAPLRTEPEAPPEKAGPTPEEEAIRDDILRKHASLGSGTYYELLGIQVTASDAEVKKAYYAMAKKYHPDRHHSPHLRDVHGLLEELFVKITEAYQTLSAPLERRRYDASVRTEAPRGEAPAGPAGSPAAPSGPSPTEKIAETRFREGKRLYDELKFFDAIQCLREAVRLDPEKAHYHKLLAKALMKNPNWRKDAEEHFLKALEKDQFDVESYLGLGQIYEAAGMGTRAQKMYGQVLSYDPGNEIAREKVLGKKTGIQSLKDMLRRKR